MKKKVRFILNPHSGMFSKKSLLMQLTSSVGKEFDSEILVTNGKGDAYQIAKKSVDLGFDAVVSVGGDGTNHEIGQALVNTNVALGMIPSGSGNGLARHLKIPKDFHESLQILKRFNVQSIDTIKVNNAYVLGIAGVGFDAHIAWKFEDSKIRGPLSYIKWILQEYPLYKEKTYELIIDGQPLEKKGLIVSFANGSQYGNDFKIAKEAVMNDGIMQVVILKTPPVYELPEILVRFKNGSLIDSKYYESISCKEVILKTKKIQAHLDGEPVFFENETKFEIHPHSLNVIIP